MVSYSGFSQDILDSTFVAPDRDVPLLEFINSVEQGGKLSFFYLDEWMEPFQVLSSHERTTLRNILRASLQDSEVDFALLHGYAVIFYKNPRRSRNRDALIRTTSAKGKEVDQVSIGEKANYRPGKKATVRCVVKDKISGNALGGATLYVHELSKGFSSDAAGVFNIVLPAGEYMFTFRHVNYEEKLAQVNAYSSGTLDVQLNVEPTMLQEVVISDQSILNSGIGQTKIKLTEIQRSPAFLGEPDLIKQIQTQSGVTTTSEAAQGFNVRGGSADQNLILFDGVPIFNTSHALGFFSAFNSDALQESSFYKSSVPAEYGGRTSSVLDITSKSGNFLKWHGKGGIGLVSSELVMDGPVKQDTSSLAFSLRSSYSDWMLNMLKTRYRGISKGSIFFYDANMKYTHKIDKNSKLFVSLYTSHDRFSIATDTVNTWNNYAFSVRYDKTLNDVWSYNLGAHWGQYSYTVEEDDPETAFNLRFGVTYPSVKIDVNRAGAAHKQTFGFQSTYYTFQPGTLTPGATSELNHVSMQKETALESAIYASDNFNLMDNVQLEAGMRISVYSRLGTGTVFRYKDNAPKEPENISDTISYSGGQFIKTYIRPEPRLAMNISLGHQSAIKAAYNRMHQYVHLITNTATITPVDIWQSSNTYFKPVRSDQFSVGYFHTSASGIYEFSLEGYYKMQANILEFKDGATLILNKQLETSLLNGKGRYYGVELTLNKNRGRLTGGFNYTFSRSKRRVAGKYDIETINQGDWYPSNSDQPHIVNLNWRYNITRRIFFTGAFTYHTGRPVSIPVSAYSVDGNIVMDFTARNNYRLSDYHRLDVAFVLEGSNKKNKRVQSFWLFSIYNVYGRKNPFSVFFTGQSGQALKPYQLSLIGTAVPSLTYQFKF